MEADLRDTLLETAASVLLNVAGTDHRVRMPISGKHPTELDTSMQEALLLEKLANVDFSATDRFERVLNLELRRVRQVGAVVILTARLSGEIVEAMVSMRRMGPQVRLCLATFTPNDGTAAPFISRLVQAGCQVGYIMPESQTM